jgi:hypothetical protein
MRLPAVAFRDFFLTGVGQEGSRVLRGSTDDKVRLRGAFLRVRFMCNDMTLHLLCIGSVVVVTSLVSPSALHGMSMLDCVVHSMEIEITLLLRLLVYGVCEEPSSNHGSKEWME